MWTLLSSSSDFVGESLIRFGESTGLAGFFSAMGWGNIVMIGIAFFLLYLAIRHKFEPLLLLTIAFGMLLTNLPGANLYHTELFAGGHVHWDIFVAKAGLLDYLYLGVKLGIYPCLIFLGVGAMTDFGPLIANPKSFLLGAAAQIGIFVTFLGAYAIGFSPEQSGSIGIIGGADGPTAIYLTSMLAPERRSRLLLHGARAGHPAAHHATAHQQARTCDPYAHAASGIENRAYPLPDHHLGRHRPAAAERNAARGLSDAG